MERGKGNQTAVLKDEGVFSVFISGLIKSDRFRIILQYCFTKRELKRFGYFRAEFGIYFTDCGTELHVPIKEKLYVNVLDTITNFN